MIFENSATWNEKREHFENFGIHPKTACLYSLKPVDIIPVTLESFEMDAEIEGRVYWGWIDSKDGKLALIWPSLAQLRICFPYGLEAETARGRGKAVKLKVISGTP